MCSPTSGRSIICPFAVVHLRRTIVGAMGRYGVRENGFDRRGFWSCSELRTVLDGPPRKGAKVGKKWVSGPHYLVGNSRYPVTESPTLCGQLCG